MSEVSTGLRNGVEHQCPHVLDSDWPKETEYISRGAGLLISLLEETHDMAVIRKEGSDPATDVYMPIARNMADAQQVAHIISILLNMAGEQE